MQNDIENRFQLLITLSILFPVLLENLGKAARETDVDIATLSLRTSAIIAFTIIDYIIFQKYKKEFPIKSLGRINTVLLWAIGAFIIPILELATMTYLPASSKMTNAVGSTFGITTLLILSLPVIIELILVIFSIRTDQKKEKRLSSKTNRKRKRKN